MVKGIMNIKIQLHLWSRLSFYQFTFRTFEIDKMMELTSRLWILIEVFLNPTHLTEDLICDMTFSRRLKVPWDAGYPEKFLSFFQRATRGPVHEWGTDEAHGPVKELAAPSLCLWSVCPSSVLVANRQTLKINRWCENESIDSCTL